MPVARARAARVPWSSLLAALCVAAGGCRGSKGASSSGTRDEGVTYSAFVSTTLEIYGCTACHGGEGGLNLTTYRALMVGGRSGPAVIPGDAKRSLLVQKLLGTAPGGRMPLDGTPLPPSKIEGISAWIDQGALDN